MHGDTARRSLNGGVTVAGSQYTSVDVTALASAAAAAATAVDKRRETSVAATVTAAPSQCICLDELAPVLEDPADN